MTTLLQSLGSISQKEANILIDKYLDIVEDLEDYLVIKKHKAGKVEYLDEKESNNLFSSLMKNEK